MFSSSSGIKLKIMDKISQILSEIYFDAENPAGYSSQLKLWRAGKEKIPKLSLKEVKKWWESETIPSRFSQRKLKFPRIPVVSHKVNDIWGSDVAIFSRLSRFNNGYLYLGIIQDIFSRKLKALFPLKTKSSKEMAKNLNTIFKNEKPNKFLDGPR